MSTQCHCCTYGKYWGKATKIDHRGDKILREISEQQGYHSPGRLLHFGGHNIVQSCFRFNLLSQKNHNTKKQKPATILRQLRLLVLIICYLDMLSVQVVVSRELQLLLF